MKPYIHAEISVKKYGGKIEDYLPIHNFFDQTKAHHADMRHRLVLHNAWGIFMCEKVLGTSIVNSDGKTVQVRDIGEDHVLQDLGRIPSLSECIQQVPIENIKFFQQPPPRKDTPSPNGLLEKARRANETQLIIDGKGLERSDFIRPNPAANMVFDGSKPAWMQAPDPEPAIDVPDAPIEMGVDDTGSSFDMPMEDMVLDGVGNPDFSTNLIPDDDEIERLLAD